MFPTQKINKKITPPQTVPSNIIGFWMLKLFGLTFHSATFLKAITDQVICLERIHDTGSDTLKVQGSDAFEVSKKTYERM